jgi:SAM-dependent methyltransferase
MAGWPRPALRGAYRLSRISAELSEAEYIDLLERHRFIHYNLEYGIPLPDATVDYLFASHFLEHLSQRHGERLAREAARVLRPGGVIRIAVPDLTARTVHDQAGERGPALDAMSVGRGRGHFARHRHMYDFEMLVELLERAGLYDVQRCEFGKGRVPDIEVLDNRPGSLVVEATKPTAGEP